MSGCNSEPRDSGTRAALHVEMLACWFAVDPRLSTTAISSSRFSLASPSSLVARLPHLITLMKPRVMALALFTAFIELMIAPTRLDPLSGFIAILGIAAGAGAAGALNMRYDADIDAVTARTAVRLIPAARSRSLGRLSLD
jgi:protoheme IX farnesyltransferase